MGCGHHIEGGAIMVRLALATCVRGKNQKPLPEPISLCLGSGEFVVLLGPNGAGKSSLLNLIAGAERPSTGDYSLMDTDLWALSEPRRAALRRNVALVEQTLISNNTLPLTARDIVAISRLGQTTGRAVLTPNDIKHIDDAMREMAITDLANSMYRTLSGGEQRKTQIARALAQEAPLMLLDEPTSGLDLLWQQKLVNIIEDLFARNKDHIGIIMSTHYTDHIPPCCTRVIMIRQGAIIIDAPPDEALTAPNLSRLFDTPLDVIRRHDRWYTVAAAERVL